MALALETRSVLAEVRTAGRRLVGYAAVFNRPARIGPEGAGGFTETIAPGAFGEAVRQGSDVLALVDHDPSRLLARTRSNTLKLQEDAHGLAFELDLPDTQLGHDIRALAERGDLGGCSFGFRVPPGGDRWNGDQRELRSVAMSEMSIVQAHPAYTETSVALRSRPAGDPAALRQRFLRSI